MLPMPMPMLVRAGEIRESYAKEASRWRSVG